MSLPIPLLERHTASRDLAALWHKAQRSRIAPEGRAPVLLLALPPAWDNRYQVLLYAQAAAQGVVVAGVQHPDDLAHVSWPGPVVLHAHWFASLFAGALSEADAGARLDRAIATIEAFCTRTGARLLWTAHNIFPHGNLFPDTYLRLRRWIFARFDMLHVMDPAHTGVLEQAFGCPAPPAFCVPHMTYHGAVPDSICAAAARLHFGIAQDAFVFGAFGSLQPYKNFDRFLEAFTALAAAHPARALAAVVGGVPGDVGFARRLVTRFADDPRITLIARRVKDAEVQYLHHAADVMVMPYSDTFNSGAALMAATFGKPFVMPQAQGTAGLIPLGAELYDPAGPGALYRVLEQIMTAQAGHPQTQGSEPQALEVRRPQQISAAFIAAVLARMT